MIVEPGQLVIPYGTAQVSSKTLTVAPCRDGRLSLECRIGHVVIRPGRTPPLRLNSGALDVSHAAFGDAEAFDIVKDRLVRHCGDFDKVPKLFLERYFEVMTGHIARHADELDRRLEPFGTLYRREDWIHSALLPLPRAQIPVADLASVPSLGADAFVAADFALWTGARLVAVMLISDAAPGAAARRAGDALRAANVAIAGVPHAVLRADATGPLAGLLPDECFRFWEGEPFPSGPLKPGLPEAPP